MRLPMFCINGIQPLIKTLSLAFIVIPHGQQFRALMQKSWSSIRRTSETTQCWRGVHLYAISAHYWPLAPTAYPAIPGNSAARTLLFGYFGRKDLPSGRTFRWHVPTNRVLPRLTATVSPPQITATRIYRRWYFINFAQSVAGDITRVQRGGFVPPA